MGICSCYLLLDFTFIISGLFEMFCSCYNLYPKMCSSLHPALWVTYDGHDLILFGVVQMDQERLRKIASAVRTGGKGTVRR